MTQTFKINNEDLHVDPAKTREFYLTQNKIIDDCKCDDCSFYTTNFIKENLEIFYILRSMGVDLEKNLTSEPTGVWCIRNDNGNILHCQQVYQTVGQILTNDVSKVNYEKTENGFKVAATFLKTDSDKVDIELLIDKI